MIDPETFQIIVIVANSLSLFSGVLAAYFLADRKIDRKASNYIKRGRESDEGKNAIAILKETRKFLEGNQVQNLFAEVAEVVKEARSLLKVLTERFASNVAEEEDGEKVELPGLPSGEP